MKTTAEAPQPERCATRPCTATTAGEAICRLCSHLGVPFDAGLLRQRYPVLDQAGIVAALKALGFAARVRRLGDPHAAPVCFPVIACTASGFEFVPDAPALALQGASGELIEAAPRAAAVNDPDGATDNKGFGFAWFATELLKHKRVWRQVLAASLFLQLLALATPLITQAVVDKVIVHRTGSTLAVLGIAMAIGIVFTGALSWTRQFLVLHTGNRVDAVLGAAVFEHLFKLPIAYYEKRATGVIAARLHGVETIREFVASAGVTLVLDIPFLLIAVAVMCFYSLTLTCIVLAVLAVIVGMSLLAAPVFRARLNQQFLLGARNQAFLTEHIAGHETVKSLQMEPLLRHRWSGYLASYLASGFMTRQISNTYVCDVSTDVVVEATGGGIDTVQTALTWTLGTELERLTLTGTTAVNGTGNALANWIVGNGAANTLNGGAGADVLEGGAGNDTVQDSSGNGVFDGGAGTDVETAGLGNDFVAGGIGNDTFTLGGGADVVAFDKGDGADTVNAPVSGAGLGELNDTLSLGKIRLAEITLSKETNDLVIRASGTTDALRLVGWYAAAANQTFTRLQVVIESTSDFVLGSTDPLRANRVEVFDFKALVSAYDAARGTSTLANWTPSGAQFLTALTSGSDVAAYGGQFAYRYALDGTVDNVGYDALVNGAAIAGFGATQQSIGSASPPMSAPLSSPLTATVSLWNSVDSWALDGAAGDSVGELGGEDIPRSPGWSVSTSSPLEAVNSEGLSVHSATVARFKSQAWL